MKIAATSIAVALALSGCGGRREGSPTNERSSTFADVEQLGRAPRWVRAYCREASRVVHGDVLCVTIVPDLVPGENENVFRPSKAGYVFEGYTGSHWVFGAFPARTGLRRYGKLERVGTARIHGRPARYLFAPATAGIFAAHMILTWREGAFVYAVSVHTGEPKQPPPRELLTIARRMRSYPSS